MSLALLYEKRIYNRRSQQIMYTQKVFGNSMIISLIIKKQEMKFWRQQRDQKVLAPVLASKENEITHSFISLLYSR